jgi:DNA-binding transcriptional MocR family regulator
MPILTEASLQRTSLRDQALAAIRHALVSGQIVPGVVYSASALAAELGVSNSPVREAMLALVDDGLMEVVPNRGYRPVALSAADTAEASPPRATSPAASPHWRSWPGSSSEPPRTATWPATSKPTAASTSCWRTRPGTGA